jgi:two-component system LytT family sensor kinase
MMELIPTRKLIKMALITSPLMGIMLVTPPYVLFVSQKFNFFVVWPGISMVIMLAWMVNIAFIKLIKQKWVLTWLRILAVGSIMFGLSYIGIYFLAEQFPLDAYKINAIRVVNILAVNIIIYILIDMVITKENKNKMELENAKLKFVNLEAEYKLLKDQINPHFLFNALSTAKALVKQKPELAEQYIVKLSEFLRASINNDKKTVSLKDEMALCDDFIALNKIRFGEAIHYKSSVQTNTADHFVPYFSLLSLIENAVKHNQFTVESPLTINIEANSEKISVSNNKKEKFRIEGSPKTGLKNLNDRYKMLTGSEIRVEDSPEKFTVSMSLLKT